MQSHPQLVRLRCSDCTKYVYDMDTGELQTYEGPGGKELPVLRGGPPPCDDCPKGSPEEEHKFLLSFKNRRLVDFRRRAKSDPCFEMPEHLRGCRVMQENFATIDEIERGEERRHHREQAQQMQMLMTVMLRR